MHGGGTADTGRGGPLGRRGEHRARSPKWMVLYDTARPTVTHPWSSHNVCRGCGTTGRRLYISARYRDGGDSRTALDKVRRLISLLFTPTMLTRPHLCLLSVVKPCRVSAAARWLYFDPRTAAERGTSFTAGAKYGIVERPCMVCTAGLSICSIAESLTPSRPP